MQSIIAPLKSNGIDNQYNQTKDIDVDFAQNMTGGKVSKVNIKKKVDKKNVKQTTTNRNQLGRKSVID